ncbi:MAG: TetR/AcrR family transcriptional regulator [Myxococcales bacterium]
MSSRKPKTPVKRVRRNADETRAEILDVAERHLLEHGPDGLRLQQIAADVGISHPAVLHHFGNREGLIQAVVARAFVSLEEDLIRSISAAQPAGDAALLSAVEQTFAVLVGKGHGRVLSWLLLSGHAPDSSRSQLKVLAEVVHQKRLAAAPGATVAYEDTVFRLLLVTLSAIGESVAGPTMRKIAGMDERQGAARFRSWMAKLLVPSELL